MAGAFELTVITPERRALSARAVSLRVPGLDGSLGILARHAPMVAALDVGLLLYRPEGAGPDEFERMFVSGGFVEVRGAEVRVVTEAGERAAEIDEARARAAEQRARERLAGGKLVSGEPVDLARAELALRRSLLRLRAREGR
jgi:F-type H+-transporting ATPase subunit epsilon